MKKLKTVIGLGFGDEGKGNVVNALSNDESIVVRFNGGGQAGHTVYNNDLTKKHIFSSIGSGTLKGAATYLSKYFSLNPSSLLVEIYHLEEKFGISPKIYVDPMTQIVTPYDIFANIEDKKNLLDGTVGVGYGKSIERQNDGYKMFAIDLTHPTIFKQKLKGVKNYYRSKLNIDVGTEVLIDRYINDSIEVYEKYIEIQTIKIIDNFDYVIFEGAQGALLDKDFGFFPNVTRSNTTIKNVYSLLDNSLFDTEMLFDMEMFLVTRAYSTRHGEGFFNNNEIKDDVFNRKFVSNIYETNYYNKFQGGFRSTILDINMLKYAVNINQTLSHNKTLVITCIDNLKTSGKEIPICKDNTITNMSFLNIMDELNCDSIITSDTPCLKIQD